MKCTFFLFMAIMSLCTFAQTDVAEHVPNLQEPREKVFTAGQPDEEGLIEIASRGVRTVLNIRPDDEPGARDETAEAGKLNLQYFYIPVTPATFTKEKLAEFSQVFQNQENRPIFIHCGSGNRVGGMWFAYRVLKEGAEWDVALEEARQIGMKPKLEEIVLPLVKEWSN